MEYLTPVIIMGGISLFLSLVIIVASRYLAEYGPCTITINGERTLQVTGGDSLLSSLFTQKIFIPSACGGKGSCGYCKVKVMGGAGELLPTELPYLSPEERENHFRLSCQVKVKNDLDVIIPEEYLSIREYKAKVKTSRDLTYDIKEIRFQLLLVDQPEFKFRPGQYIQFHVPNAKGEIIYRAYSISSLPSTPGEIELIVRLVPGGIGSTYIHNLKKGDECIISGPYGEFFLDESTDADVICVGGGAGMAPLKSIIYSLFERKTKRKVYLFFGVRATKDLFYVEEFEALSKEHPNFHYVFALSSPEETDEWEGETGFIHLVLDKHLKEGEQMNAYLCGPPVMIDAVIKVLREKGINDDRIHYDKF